MLCVAATNPLGYDALGINWEVAQENRSRTRPHDGPGQACVWSDRCTSRNAQRSTRAGAVWLPRNGAAISIPINRMGAEDLKGKDPVDAMIERGAGIIGTPDDAIAQIERLEQKIPNFGAYLMLAHNWANFEDTKRSYALFAQHVKPHFNRANTARAESLKWAADQLRRVHGRRDGCRGEDDREVPARRSGKSQEKDRLSGAANQRASAPSQRCWKKSSCGARKRATTSICGRISNHSSEFGAYLGHCGSPSPLGSPLAREVDPVAVHRRRHGLVLRRRQHPNDRAAICRTCRTRTESPSRARRRVLCRGGVRNT